MSNEPTIQDVLNAVKSVEKHTDARFETMGKNTNAQFEEVLEVMNAASTETEERFVDLKRDFRQELNKQKLEILDAMDDKLVNLKGDLILVMRKEDHKLAELVGILKQRRVITDDDVRRILGMEPFPQPS